MEYCETSGVELTARFCRAQTEKRETFHELPRGIDALPLAADGGSRAKQRTSAFNRAGWRRAERLLRRLRSLGRRVRDLGDHPASGSN